MVRDEAAKSKLRKQVGDIGLILLVYSLLCSHLNSLIKDNTVSSTLYESKGLEFDDVRARRPGSEPPLES